MAIRLPDFRGRELPTTRGEVDRREAAPTFRPRLSQPSRGPFRQIQQTGEKITQIGLAMKGRHERGRTTEMVSRFSVEMQKIGDDIPPTQYGNRGEIIAEKAKNLREQFVSIAQDEGWLPDNISKLHQLLTADAAAAEISALKTAKGQEQGWHRENIKNVMREQLQRVETLAFDDINFSTHKSTMIIQEALDAASGVLSEAELAGNMQGWFIKKEDEYMEHLVEVAPESMLDYRAKFSLEGERYRKEARRALASGAGAAKKEFKAAVANIGTHIINLTSSMDNATDSQWSKPSYVTQAINDITTAREYINQLEKSQTSIDATDWNKLKNFKSDLKALQQTNRWAEKIVLADNDNQFEQLLASFSMYAGSKEVRNAPGRLATALKGQLPRLQKLVKERQDILKLGAEWRGALDAEDQIVDGLRTISELKTVREASVHAKLLTHQRDAYVLILDGMTGPEKLTDTHDFIRKKKFLETRISHIAVELRKTSERKSNILNNETIMRVLTGNYYGPPGSAEAALKSALNKTGEDGTSYGQELAANLISDSGTVAANSNFNAVNGIVASAGFIPEAVVAKLISTFGAVHVNSTDQEYQAVGTATEMLRTLYKTNHLAVKNAIPKVLLDWVVALPDGGGIKDVGIFYRATRDAAEKKRAAQTTPKSVD